jgi:hypothetical protein
VPTGLVQNSYDNASGFGHHNSNHVLSFIDLRGWCDAEMRDWVINPFSIFKSRNRVIYFDVSSPSFPVLSSLSVSNITSSGGRLTAST